MYRIIYAIFYLLSLLPLWLLYLFTDVVFLLVYYVIGYRKNVVFYNLSIAFPEKSEADRKAIAKKFYRNFTDFFAETIKLFSAGEKFISNHFTGNYSLINNFLHEGKKCQVHLGHNFNWELGYHSGVQNIKGTVLGVYMPLSNKIFEKIFLKLRSRFGGNLLPATNMRKAILPFRNLPYALVLVADQSPHHHTKGTWVRFFNKPTSFYTAPENGARIAGMPVIFCHVTKLKRGFYQVHFMLATNNAALMEKEALTKMYVQFLEEKMSMSPDMWLWTHKRWKWEWKEEYGPVL
ncbi:MAG: lysophospholipid acyltransferase family protein [Bacteroidota bacterium]